MSIRLATCDVGGSRWHVGIAAVAVAFSMLPLLFPYFVSQDGPNHVATAQALKALLSGHPRSFLDAYELNASQITNSFVHWVLAALLLVVPSSLAERLVVSFLIASVPLSLIWLASRFPTRSPEVLIAAIPFGFSLALVIGNYNTIFSLIFCFFALSVLARCEGCFEGRDLIGWGGWLALSVWAHPLGLLFAGACGSAIALGFWLRTIPKDGLRGFAVWHVAWEEFRVGAMRRLVLPLLVAMPAAAVVLLHVVQSDVGHSTGALENPSLSYRLRNLLLLRQLYALDSRQIALGVGLGLLLWASVAWTLARRARVDGRRLEVPDVLLFAAAVAAGVFLAIPDGGGGAGFLVQRLDGVAALFALAWLSTQSLGNRERIVWLIGSGAAVLLFAISNAIALFRINRQAEPYINVLEAIEVGKVVLAVAVANKPIINEQPVYPSTFFHLHHELADAKEAVMLQNWNAHYPGFPTRFRSSWDPHDSFSPYGLAEKDLCDWEKRSDAQLDYVFVWHRPEETAQSASAAAFFQRTLENYVLVASARNELGFEAKLFRRFRQKAC